MFKGGLGDVGFCGGRLGRLETPEEPRKARGEPTHDTKLESNLSHIGARQVLLLLCNPTPHTNGQRFKHWNEGIGRGHE